MLAGMARINLKSRTRPNNSKLPRNLATWRVRRHDYPLIAGRKNALSTANRVFCRQSDRGRFQLLLTASFWRTSTIFRGCHTFLRSASLRLKICNPTWMRPPRKVCARVVTVWSVALFGEFSSERSFNHKITRVHNCRVNGSPLVVLTDR